MLGVHTVGATPPADGALGCCRRWSKRLRRAAAAATTSARSRSSPICEGSKAWRIASQLAPHARPHFLRRVTRRGASHHSWPHTGTGQHKGQEKACVVSRQSKLRGHGNKALMEGHTQPRRGTGRRSSRRKGSGGVGGMNDGADQREHSRGETGRQDRERRVGRKGDWPEGYEAFGG
eukprot:364270-Chlamydomonas_euryale.AAC.3